MFKTNIYITTSLNIFYVFSLFSLYLYLMLMHMLLFYLCTLRNLRNPCSGLYFLLILKHKIGSNQNSVKLKYLPIINRPIPTLNGFGYQLGSPSPLLQHWLESYDGTHPLLDVGCAYGIKTLKAIEKGIPTVALDPEEKHLEILRISLNEKPLHLVKCVVGSLPSDLGFPDETFSGILCSEVLHFLDGKGIEESIKTMKGKLASGGNLLMMETSYLKYIHPARGIQFQEELEAGVKWPGFIRCDDDFLNRIERITKSKFMQSTVRKLVPDFLHFVCVEQMTDELKRCGFDVKTVHLGDHPGHPDVEGTKIFPGQTLQIVAKKK